MAKKVLIAVGVLILAWWSWQVWGPIGTGESAYKKAEAAFHAMQYEKAARAYAAAMTGELEEKHKELAYYRRASSLEELKRWQEAISAYELAIQKYPHGAEANRAQGQVEWIKLQQGLK